ncbi:MULTISPECIES: hypothetical protein [Bacillus]|nr:MULTISPECIES: hypothetical protein [Bacillus]
MKKIDELKDEEKENHFNWKIALVTVGIFFIWRFEGIKRRN